MATTRAQQPPPMPQADPLPPLAVPRGRHVLTSSPSRAQPARVRDRTMYSPQSPPSPGPPAWRHLSEGSRPGRPGRQGLLQDASASATHRDQQVLADGVQEDLDVGADPTDPGRARRLALPPPRCPQLSHRHAVPLSDPSHQRPDRLTSQRSRTEDSKPMTPAFRTTATIKGEAGRPPPIRVAYTPSTAHSTPSAASCASCSALSLARRALVLFVHAPNDRPSELL